MWKSFLCQKFGKWPFWGVKISIYAYVYADVYINIYDIDAVYKSDMISITAPDLKANCSASLNHGI